MSTNVSLKCYYRLTISSGISLQLWGWVILKYLLLIKALFSFLFFLPPLSKNNLGLMAARERKA